MVQVEAVVLRTWPIHEADQIVSLFTRDYGKIKGVAKAAAKSRRRFGGALEPMTHVRAHYATKPNQELVRLDSFEILHSPLAESVDYARATALAFFAEVLEQTLPDHDPHETVFRLLLSVLEQNAQADWRELLGAVSIQPDQGPDLEGEIEDDPAPPAGGEAAPGAADDDDLATFRI